MADVFSTYVVARGETLAGIAAKLGVTLADLAHWNGLGTGAGVPAGRVLHYLASGGPAEAAAALPWQYLTVEAGQTLDSLAAKLEVSRENLAYWNGIGTGAGLRAGQVLRWLTSTFIRQHPSEVPVKVTAAAATAATAARETAATSEPNSAAWQPWLSLITVANRRYKVEVQGATAQLNTDLTAAGRLLDQAVAAANAAAAPLEAAAWAAWSKYMTEASTARASILTPALAAYDNAVAAAGSTFDQLMSDAQATHHEAALRVTRIQEAAALIGSVA